MVNQLPISFPFCSSWEYFVWGYSLAGAIIERITKRPFKDVLSESFSQSLGMKLAKPYAGLSDGSAFPLAKLQVFEASG